MCSGSTDSEVYVEVSNINLPGYKKIMLHSYSSKKTYKIKNTYSNATGFLIKNEIHVAGAYQRESFSEVKPGRIFEIDKKGTNVFFTDEITIV